MPPTLAQIGQRFWMPDAISSSAGATDWLFYFIYWASAAGFLIVVTLMVFFAIRYRARPGHVEQPSPSHSTPLELTWSLIPTAIFLAIFYYGFKGFMDLAAPPDYAYEVKVVASKWRWEFVYPNQAASDTLHVPKDVPIRLLLQSDDVIHSLFVPTFRIKKDAVPKRLNTTWFKAEKTGEYDLFCAEYCGTRHSMMLSKVVVQEPEAFNAWLDNAANWVASVPPVEAGAKLYTTKGCFQCHSTDGRAGTGPSFKDLFGHDVALVGGKTVLADENYIRDSMLDPAGQVVAGYAAVMPTYQGRLKDAELTALTEWIKSLSDKAPATKIELPATEKAPAAEPQSSTPNS